MILDNYFKHDFVKKVFMESCFFINDIEQAELLAKTLLFKCNVIFSKSYLKSVFFNKVKIYHPHIKIINCDSSNSRLLNEMEYNDNLIIFDKVNYCCNIDIFEIINNINNRVLIC